MISYKVAEAARDLADGAGGRGGCVDKDLVPKLDSGDILIDGGNSYYIDDIRRAKELQPKASTTLTWEPVAACGDSSAAIAR